MNDLHMAYQTESGIQAICPTTNQAYITNRARFSRYNDRRVVSCDCRHCDAMLRTRTDPGFDPSEPQIHIYFVSEGHQ